MQSENTEVADRTDPATPKYATAFDIGPELGEALGLDGLGVLGIKLDISVSRGTTVTVERFVTPEEVAGIVSVFEKYKLIGNEDLAALSYTPKDLSRRERQLSGHVSKANPVENDGC